MAKTSSQSLFSAFLEDYKITIEDKTDGTRIGEMLRNLWRTIGSIADSGGIVSDAINSYSLMQIQLFNGKTLPRECCYAGGMADYEQDEATLYIAADRALDTATQPLEIGAGNVCTDFRSVVAHEIGHLVMPFAEEMLGEKFAITYDMYPKEYWEKNVSRYAGTSDRELFGEAFAAYTHPGYGDNIIPAVLESIFNALGISNGLAKIARTKKDQKKKTKKQEYVEILTDDGTVIAATKIKDIVDSIDDADWFELEGDISPALLKAFSDAGYTELAGTSSAGEETLFNAVNKGAETYAEEHSADLVTGIKESTRDMLRGTIEDAVKEGWDQDELAEEIANNYGFSETRADTIAKNELGQAYSRGRIDAAEGAGATKKRSLLSADHDDAEDCDCTDAAEAGAVDFDESFTDDDDYDFPPYHVNCQCDWIGVYPGDDDDEGDDAGDSDEGDIDDSEIDDEEHGKMAKGGDDQERDSHGRWTKEGISDDLSNLLDMEQDGLVNGMTATMRGHDVESKEVQRAALHSIIHTAKEKTDDRYKTKHANEARRILRQHFGEDVAKRIMDNDPEDYVEHELTTAETDENNHCMELSAIALNLSSPVDNTGQRISGKADACTRQAVMNYENAGSRSSDHRVAYEFHTEASLHYRQMGNVESEKAHQDAADAHKKITLRLAAEWQALNKVAIDNDAHEAATSTRNDLAEPSDEMKSAGNYKMGHFVINGVRITIENPAGSARRKGWQTLKAHYGYIKLTEGADGDHIDVFVREGTQDTYNGPVYVIDQYINGSFDEHKCMIGFVSKQKAVATYLGSYQDGWKCGPVTRLSWKVFREWVDEHTHLNPISQE